MINKIAFTEKFVTKNLEKTVQQVAGYISESTLLPQMTEKAAKVEAKSIYSSPFALILDAEPKNVSVVNRNGLNFFA